MTPAHTIPEIDFLPAEYREKRVRLQTQPWQLIVSLVVVALVAGTAGVQYHRRSQLAAELAMVTPQYDAALQQNLRLSELQGQLAAARADAELFTYLQHPWPSTRILDALLASLPNEVVLEKLQIQREAKGQRGWSGEDRDKASQDKLKKMAPAARDLKQLRQQCDTQPITVVLSGFTQDTAALYRYLGQLAKTPLVAKADLASIEKAPKGPKSSSEQLHFSVTVLLRPGYGQPGGPTNQDKLAKPLSTAQVSTAH